MKDNWSDEYIQSLEDRIDVAKSACADEYHCVDCALNMIFGILDMDTDPRPCYCDGLDPHLKHCPRAASTER
jgi:hypothetical protein